MQLLMVTLYLVACALVMRVFTIKLGLLVIRLLDSAFCCTNYIFIFASWDWEGPCLIYKCKLDIQTQL